MSPPDDLAPQPLDGFDDLEEPCVRCDYDQMLTELLVRLGAFGNLTPMRADEWDERVALAIQDVTGLNVERWHRLSRSACVPYLQRTVACLSLAATPPAPQPESLVADGRAEDVRAYVTLLQMACMVNKSKRTLEERKKRKKNPLPDPDVPGGSGEADEWLWDRIRPWLETEFNRRLPEKFNPQAFKLKK